MSNYCARLSCLLLLALLLATPQVHAQDDSLAGSFLSGESN